MGAKIDQKNVKNCPVLVGFSGLFWTSLGVSGENSLASRGFLKRYLYLKTLKDWGVFKVFATEACGCVQDSDGTLWFILFFLWPFWFRYCLQNGCKIAQKWVQEMANKMN